MTPITLLLDSCDATAGLLASDVLGDHWGETSALIEWTNAGLAGHLARSAFNFERAVHAQDPSGIAVSDAVAYYTRKDPEPADTQIGQRIRELGDHEAADGQHALVRRFTETVGRLRALCEPETDRQVQLFECMLPIQECSTACLLELVVHTEDLAAGLDVAAPELPREATDLAIATLARISARRHGPTMMINALARPERRAGSVSAF